MEKVLRGGEREEMGKERREDYEGMSHLQETHLHLSLNTTLIVFSTTLVGSEPDGGLKPQ